MGCLVREGRGWERRGEVWVGGAWEGGWGWRRLITPTHDKCGCYWVDWVDWVEMWRRRTEEREVRTNEQTDKKRWKLGHSDAKRVHLRGGGGEEQEVEEEREKRERGGGEGERED